MLNKGHKNHGYHKCAQCERVDGNFWTGLIQVCRTHKICVPLIGYNYVQDMSAPDWVQECGTHKICVPQQHENIDSQTKVLLSHAHKYS